MFAARTARVHAREIVAGRTEYEHDVEPRIEGTNGTSECIEHRFAGTARRRKKFRHRVEQPARVEIRSARSKPATGGATPHALEECPHAAAARSYFFGSGLAGFPATRAPAGTSLVTTEPAPVSALSPIVSGATIEVFEPIETLRPIVVWFLLFAVVVASDRAGADVRFFAERRVAEIRKMRRFRAARVTRVLDFDEVTDAVVPVELGVATDMRERPNRGARSDIALGNDALANVTRSSMRAAERREFGPMAQCSPISLSRDIVVFG